MRHLPLPTCPPPGPVADLAELHAAFLLLDIDGSGEVSRLELFERLRDLGTSATPAELRAMVGGSAGGRPGGPEGGWCWCRYACAKCACVGATSHQHARMYAKQTGVGCYFVYFAVAYTCSSR